MSVDDAVLVRAAARGDTDAWNALVDRHSGLVYANARAVGASPEVAADISQVVWMRLLTRLDSIRDPSKVRGWLAIVARNATRKELSRRPYTAPLDGIPELMAPPAQQPEHLVIQDATARLVSTALSRLSRNCQRLLTLLFGEDLSYAEIAAETGLPIGSIGPTRGRCLEAMKSEVQKLDRS